MAGSLFLANLVTSPCAFAQADPELINPVLGQEIVSPSVSVFQMKRYILGRVAKPPVATTAQEWTAEANHLRRHLLDDVVFHGWPKAWIDAPPHFEDLGVIEGGPGYRLRKLRYEIVPGFQSVAILYEPEHLTGKMPAILNVHGHVGPPGKAVEYKQKRCINFARHGILALNLEWFDFGELAQPENSHWFGAHLDLVGADSLGLFYLEMRRGLDCLAANPNVDPKRLGVTGLSGGGWQTLVLSALDERVAVAVPVAGYSSLTAKVEALKYGDLGDLEQNATDLLDGVDFTHLTAMRAPRPTLLVHNAEDDCCYRAPLVKPLNYDAIRPFFKLYGKEDDFAWHENRDPSTHNYQLDNRLASYRFFSAHFGLPPMDDEAGIAPQIKSYDQLVVGLPKDNLTILGLAREMAKEIRREPVPADPAARSAWADAERTKLKQVVRLKPVSVARAWRVANTKDKGVETLSYLFETSDGLAANGVWLKGIAAQEPSPLTIVLNDQGRKAAGAEVSDRVNRGEQVLALDLLFIGGAWKAPVGTSETEPFMYAQILDGLGDRPLGLEAGQLIAIAQWMRRHQTVANLRLEATGMRSQVVATVAAALEPTLFSAAVIHEGIRSLSFVLEAPVTFQEAPELFCLDLYKYFDMNSLASISTPTTVRIERYLELPKKELHP
ncbi:MAG TPA: prolyl oligopeptidase family serine peptidase [Terriglobia bacterium]|nr:prolyl oligopeptidase family serine peptidase [Terriglobia bacterium]